MAELITNGDFASGDTGWTLTGSATVVSEEMRFQTSSGTIKQVSIFSAGATYSVSVDARGALGNTESSINIYNGSGSTQLIGSISDGTSSGTFVFEFTASASDGALYITSSTPGEGSVTYLDDISVTQTGAAAATGGGGPRRKVRRTAIIDGKEIQVSSFEEAQRLFQHFKKTKEAPTKKALRFKVIQKASKFKISPKKGISIKRK